MTYVHTDSLEPNFVIVGSLFSFYSANWTHSLLKGMVQEARRLMPLFHPVNSLTTL